MSYYSPPSDPYRVSYTETPSTYQTSYSEYSTPASYASYSSPYDQGAEYYTSTPSRRSPPRTEYYDDKYYDDVHSPSKSKSHKKRISASGLASHVPASSEYRRPTSSSTSSKHHAPRLLPPPEPERRSKSSKSSGSSRAMVVAPRSPEITRLGTPDMGDIEHGRFCSCCPPMEDWEYGDEAYRDGRGKMDNQLSTAKAYISKKKGGRLLEYR